MNFCMECGCRLEKRFLEKEGMIPFCRDCNEFRFPVFNTAVSMIVVDTTANKILLIKQYGKPNYVLVAGYVSRGENAETAVRREVKEEMGLELDEIKFCRSRFFEPSNTLMLNFVCYTSNIDSLCPNDEIDSYSWFTFDEARQNIMKNSLAKEFLCAYIDGVDNNA